MQCLSYIQRELIYSDFILAARLWFGGGGGGGGGGGIIDEYGPARITLD